MTDAAMILREDLAAIGDHVAGALNQGAVVTRLPPLTSQAVLKQVQSSFTALQEVAIGDVLQLAWSASKTIQKAVRASISTGQPQPIHLDGYAIPVDYQPTLDVLINGRKVATIHFVLSLALELFNLDGMVERGRLMRLSAQTFDVTVSLSMAGRTLAARKARLNLAVELPLPADGLPLGRR
jgi:hypothetical protein